MTTILRRRSWFLLFVVVVIIIYNFEEGITFCYTFCLRYLIHSLCYTLAVWWSCCCFCKRQKSYFKFISIILCCRLQIYSFSLFLSLSLNKLLEFYWSGNFLCAVWLLFFGFTLSSADSIFLNPTPWNVKHFHLKSFSSRVFLFLYYILQPTHFIIESHITSNKKVSSYDSYKYIGF